MTNTIGRVSLTLALVAATAPATARDARPGTGNAAVSEQRVSFADLDLRQAAARQALTHRVRIAARKVCFWRGQPASSLPMQESCFAATYRSARRQVTAAIQLADAGKAQPAMSLVVRRTTAAVE